MSLTRDWLYEGFNSKLISKFNWLKINYQYYKKNSGVWSGYIGLDMSLWAMAVQTLLRDYKLIGILVLWALSLQDSSE